MSEARSFFLCGEGGGVVVHGQIHGQAEGLGEAAPAFVSPRAIQWRLSSTPLIVQRECVMFYHAVFLLHAAFLRMIQTPKLPLHRSLKHVELAVGEGWAHQVRLISGDTTRALRLMASAGHAEDRWARWREVLEVGGGGNQEPAVFPGGSSCLGGGACCSRRRCDSCTMARPDHAAPVHGGCPARLSSSLTPCPPPRSSQRSAIPRAPTRKLVTPPKARDAESRSQTTSPVKLPLALGTAGATSAASPARRVPSVPSSADQVSSRASQLRCLGEEAGRGMPDEGHCRQVPLACAAGRARHTCHALSEAPISSEL